MYIEEVAMKKWKQQLFLKYVRLQKIMVVFYCYLERENDKVFKFHLNNSSYID